VHTDVAFEDPHEAADDVTPGIVVTVTHAGTSLDVAYFDNVGSAVEYIRSWDGTDDAEFAVTNLAARHGSSWTRDGEFDTT
jgi:hypothetical protein